MSIDVSNTRMNNDLQDAVLESKDVSHFLDHLCQNAVESLSAGEQVLCGITLLRDRKAATVASSSEYARKMDEVQYNFGDGPCLSAAREQTIMEVPDVDREKRWSKYIEAITGHGLHSILAVPFALGGEAKAALNLYSETPGEFGAAKVATAKSYVGEASRSLRLAVRVAQNSEYAADLKAAMESRTVIDIAVGIVMGQSHCGQSEAFEILKKASSHRNMKLRELAGLVVAGPDAFPEPTTHFDS